MKKRSMQQENMLNKVVIQLELAIQFTNFNR
jgi:hypothetical protein